MRDPLSVWAAHDYVPADARVQELAIDAVALSGGPREPGTEAANARVAGALSAWFSSEISELLRAGDDEAIERQAYFLLNSESTNIFDRSWAHAVMEAFPAATTGRPLYFGENGKPPANPYGSSLPLLLRGMRLYAAAFEKLAAEHGFGSLKVFRVLPDPVRNEPQRPVSDRPQLNAVAAASWNRSHRSLEKSTTVWSAEVDPYQVVGVTLYRECHPMVTPFRLDRGPDGGLIDWRQAPLPYPSG